MVRGFLISRDELLSDASARVIGTNSAGINACLKAGFRHTGTLERFFHSIQRSDIKRVYDMLYFERIIAVSNGFRAQLTHRSGCACLGQAEGPRRGLASKVCKSA